jgi:hypothetical protein
MASSFNQVGLETNDEPPFTKSAELPPLANRQDVALLSV